MNRFLNPRHFNKLIFLYYKSRRQNKRLILFRLFIFNKLLLMLHSKMHKISILKQIIFSPCQKYINILSFILKSKKPMQPMLPEKHKFVINFILLSLFKYLHLLFEIKYFFFYFIILLLVLNYWLHVIIVFNFIFVLIVFFF